jgi:hypothetical protein
MNVVRILTRALALTLLISASGVAHAQYVSSIQPDPLYPYAQPQYAPPGYPYVRTVPAQAAPPPRVSKTDPALIEELRKIRHKTKKEIVAVEKKASKTDDKQIKVGNKEIKIDKKIVVREKPVVRKHYRVIDDPPIVVQREIDESQLPPAPPPRAEHPTPGRIIHAEAEVTILGPDRMSIRLYRKPDGRAANAKALPKKTKASKTAGKDEPQT